MCGICGDVDFTRRQSLDRLAMEGLLRSILHRGPDDQGVYRDEVACLGHRRLSIIDFSENGRQPMSNEDGSLLIVFNGEIYNFLEHRERLVQKGHVFRSRTDTEVILHLYEEEGDEFLQQLNGMFAFALWDRRRQRLILARDRLGVKPLVYTHRHGRVLFASEIKALLLHPLVSKEVDPEALEAYFTFNFIPAPWTIYRGIRKLEPGHFLVVDASGLTKTRYWDLPQTGGRIEDEQEAIHTLRTLLADASRMRMISDAPLGAFLSGGIDSSIVVANMARHSAHPVRTFFVRYGKDYAFDESGYARAVASRYGTRHEEIELSPDAGLECLETMLSSFDEPFADSSTIPTYLLCRETRKHVKVALSGDGGDELFGGYRRYLGERYVHSFLRIPRPLRERVVTPLILKLPDSKERPWLEYCRRLKIFVEGAGHEPRLRHLSWLNYFPERDRDEIFPLAVKQTFHSVGRQVIGSHFDAFPGSDPINRMLYVDVKNLLTADMLNKVDWMSMANSLEVRSPLLDYRVAEYAFSLSGKLKIRGNQLKYILKKAYQADLPRELRNRPKQGFEVPIGQWFRRDPKFRKLFWGVVNPGDLEKQQILRWEKIQSLYEEHERNRRDNSHKLWAILVFQWWYQNQ